MSLIHSWSCLIEAMVTRLGFQFVREWGALPGILSHVTSE